MSVITSIQITLGKVGHAFATGASKLKAAIITAAKDIDGAKPEIATITKVAENIVEEIYPGSAVVVNAFEAGMDKLFDILDKADAAAEANLLNIGFDQVTIDAIKTALPIIKAQAVTTPGS